MAETEIAGTERRHWAWRVATISGIPVRLHFTLLLLLVWFTWIELEAAGGGGTAATGSLAWAIVGRLLFVLGLFASVLFHEIGHALVAKGYGVRTTEIVLYPFGGVARLRGIGTPRQELWVSLAGPGVNLLLALVIFGGLMLTRRWVPVEQLGQGDVHLFQRLMGANLVLAVFNLIPAFPMDGGRVLRSLLARRYGMVRGTGIAASIGQALAIVFGLVGLITGNFLLVFIAFFVFVSAGQEVSAQRSLALMRGQTVSSAMITRYERLHHADSLGQAADYLLTTHQQDFPVIAGDDVIGVLTRADLVRGLAEHGARAYVAGSAHRQYVRLSPQLELREAVEMLQAAGQRVALVFEGEKLVGMLTEENVGEFFQVREAGGAGERGAAPPNHDGTGA